MAKLLTVVIPTYNRPELTDRAIESVRTDNQNRQRVEIVVVDDCGSIPYSHPPTNESNVRVRVIRLEKNVGAGMAREAGVRQANGQFIAFLDSDDRYDERWLDWTIAEIARVLTPDGLLISGVTAGERRTGAIVRKAIAALPQNHVLMAARTVAILFNPFYAPSLVMSRDLCRFKPVLRHCEDYYSTVAALFMANQLMLPDVVACHLGREPSSEGGESAAREEMFKGEMTTRKSMLNELPLPILYKCLVPLGMAYQYLRTGLKIFLGLLR